MRAILAAIFLCLFALFAAPAAQARPVHHVGHSHHHPHHRAHAHRGPVGVIAGESAFAPASGLAGIMARYLGTNPTGLARNWCGVGLGMVARAAGYAPPPGYAAAANWRHFGRPASGPSPGIVAVFAHHVGIVTKVLSVGSIELISANHGHKVGVGVYQSSRVIAWRVPA